VKQDVSRVDWSSVRRVLVVKLRHHGDVLLTTPVLRTLKQQLPQVEVDALIYDETRDMLVDNPHLDQLFTIKKTRAAGGNWKKLQHELDLLGALRARQYDVILNLTEHNRGASLTRLLKPRWSVGQDGPYSGFYKRSFTHLFRPLWANRRHTIERNLDALRMLGLFPADADKGMALEPGAAARAAVNSRLQEAGLRKGAYLVVHPGSRWAYKTWPAARVAELISRLRQDGHTIVVTGSPDAAERAFVAEMFAALPDRSGITDLSGQLSLRELGAVIATSRMLIGVDSVPMHMAAALGTPLVALFGPSGDIEWGPWRAVHRIVAQDMPCRPCEMKGCGDSGYSECLATLPVEQVYAAAQALLAGEH
jgi:heptosyltransferase-3